MVSSPTTLSSSWSFSSNLVVSMLFSKNLPDLYSFFHLEISSGDIVYFLAISTWLMLPDSTDSTTCLLNFSSNVLLALMADKTFLSSFWSSSAYFNLSYFSIQCVQGSGFTPIIYQY